MTQAHIQTRRPEWTRRLRWMLAIGFMAHLVFGPADAYAAEFSEEDALKAAFIFHFTHFVNWPADRAETITIGVLGEDPFNGALETIRGKTVNGKPIRIKQLLSTDAAIEDVHVLVVGWLDENAVASIIERVADRPILTIADFDVFKVESVMISLFRKGTRQKFGVDRQSASRAGLTFSSQLLQIAEVTW